MSVAEGWEGMEVDVTQTDTVLTGKQADFIEALLTTRTIEEAANQSGISRRTAYRYLQSQHVRDKVASLQTDGLQSVLHEAVGAMGLAVTTLREIAGDGKAPYGARVSASRALLEVGLRLKELLDLGERLATLEEAMGVEE